MLEATDGYTIRAVDDKHEGRHLVALLHEAGKTQSDLARALNMTTAAVAKHAKTEVFRPAALETVRRGLQSLGIDADRLRPVAVSMSRTRVTDLRHLLKGFTVGQLRSVLQILDAPEDAQGMLRVVIETIIEERDAGARGR